jgi:hypothetical protein
MKDTCPGASNVKGTPTLKIKICPDCGGEIELFSNEISAACKTCGFVACNDTQSCILWCSKAKECIGEVLYNQIVDKIQVE